MARVSEDDLSEEFSMFGIELPNDGVCAKLLKLCGCYGIDAARIVTQWIAYAQTYKIGSLDLEQLEIFDKKWLVKKCGKSSVVKEQPMILDINSIQEPMDDEDDEAVSLIGTYASTPITPISKPQSGQKRQITPETATVKRFTGAGRSPSAAFSTSITISPAGVTPSRKYSSRANAGEVVCSFGNTAGLTWTGGVPDCLVEHIDPETALTTPFKHMFQKQADKAAVLNDQIEDMVAQLQAKHSIEEFTPVCSMSQEPIDIVGRIFCDSNGKLNAKSVMLQGCRSISGGRTVPVDLSELPSFSLFPGQIVAFNGFNPNGQTFMAKKLYESVGLPQAQVNNINVQGTRLSVVIAAGPFTTSDSLANEPLQDLLTQLQKQTPDVCILFGPFVDSKNEEIEKGSVDQTFDELFRRQMIVIGETAARLGCHMVLLPSVRDVHHSYVYPLAPFSFTSLFGEKGGKDSANERVKKYVHLMSDPCTLAINGVVFGLTATDVIMHLSGEEISFPPGSPDRLGRLVTHLLHQHSFYPLYPPAEEMCIEYEQLDIHCRLSVKPHVLVTPSDLRYFVKDVGGCCCINPGRLAKGQVGGTFCRLSIKLPDSASAASLLADTAVEVVRV